MTERTFDEPRLRGGDKELPVGYTYWLDMATHEVFPSDVHFYDHSLYTLFSSIRA